MPNDCSNTLTVSVIKKNKKSLEQLQKFITDAENEGEVVKSTEANAFRTKYLKDNFKNYRDAADVYLVQRTMSIKKFMEAVLYYTFRKDKKIFQKDENPLCMNNILPCPEELSHPDLESYGGDNEPEKEALRQAMTKKYGFKSWYDWHCAKWGTKWDTYNCDRDICIEDGFVEYNFNTAWSPICPFLEAIGEKYPLLKFELYYEEEGCDFEGDFVVEAGEVTLDDERKFSNHSCNNCGDRQDDFNEGETLNEDGLCPNCAEEQEED